MIGYGLMLVLGAFGWGGGSPVGAGPGTWVRPSILTGCGLMLGLGAFDWGGVKLRAGRNSVLINS